MLAQYTITTLYVEVFPTSCIHFRNYNYFTCEAIFKSDEGTVKCLIQSAVGSLTLLLWTQGGCDAMQCVILFRPGVLAVGVQVPVFGEYDVIDYVIPLEHLVRDKWLLMQ